MRIAPIRYYSNIDNVKSTQNHSNHKNYSYSFPMIQDNVSFQANAGKIVGGILGTAAVVVFAPAVAMAGLAGIGTLLGALAGDIVDQKIEENDDNDHTK